MSPPRLWSIGDREARELFHIEQDVRMEARDVSLPTVDANRGAHVGLDRQGQASIRGDHETQSHGNGPLGSDCETL